jgi:4-hydroxymandelate oxidase
MESPPHQFHPISELLNLFEYEEAARRKLSQSSYEYFAGFAADGITDESNHQDFAQLRLLPRVMVDVSQRSKGINLFGRKLSVPILAAPMAFQAMAHPKGELATASACEALGTTFILSTFSNYSVEDVCEKVDSDIWFQLYVYKDKGLTKNLVQRATQSGCKAIVVTVDVPLIGKRENDIRNRFHLPADLSIANWQNTSSDSLKKLPGDLPDSGLAAYFASLYDCTLTWKDLEWLVSLTDVPVLVKGILRPDDALRAIQSGATGIIVSNHGGRQLDTSISTIKALPPVVQAVNSFDSNIPILVDGGIRRGTDVLKALALGATAVLLGRPLIWGVTVDGAAGVAHVLQLLMDEFDLAMALAGCDDIASITSDLVVQ